MSDFIRNVQKLNNKRKWKITNSYGCRYYYQYHIHKRNKKFPEALFRQILIDIMEQLIDDYLLKYLRVKLPYRMGELFIKQYDPKVKQLPNGKYVKNVPVNWRKTLEFWESDSEAYEKRILVHNDIPSYHRIIYETKNGSFHNHHMFKLHICRELNRKIYNKLTLNKNFRLWQNDTLL